LPGPLPGRKQQHIPAFSRQFLNHALCLLHFGKIGVDKAKAFKALVAEGAPDDHSLRAVRRKQAGERATDTVRAADHGHFLPRREPRGRGWRSHWTSPRRTPLILLNISANFIDRPPMELRVDHFFAPAVLLLELVL
jgi:hypothetical protein